MHRTLHWLALLTTSALAAPPWVDDVFDYIVVGGGTAGLTLASRLTENPRMRVAVIEAGSFYEIDTGDTLQIPANAAVFNGKSPDLTDPLVEWGFMTTPQAGINNQTVHYPRGKTLGGSSAINAMAYQRPTVGSMDLWAELVGDDSWNWENTYPYFQKSVNFTAPDHAVRFANSTPQYDPDLLETDGELALTHPNYAQSLSSWLAQTMPALGMPNVPGFTSGALNGSGWLMHTIDQDKGIRHSSEVAFLARFLDRPNLVVYNRTRAERILFRGKTAKGVLATPLATDRPTTPKSITLSARREVIVTAGAFQSPQLLMVSGVGPADLLRSLNIPVVADRPGVGQNMEDHIFFGISYRVNLMTVDSLSDPEYAASVAELYAQQQAGPLSAPGGDYAAFEKLPGPFRTGLSNETEEVLRQLPSDWPEMLYLSLPAYVGDFYNPLVNTPAARGDEGNYATLLASLMTPHSRGSVSISSPYMRDPPLINPNWLTAAMDIELTTAAFRRLRDIYSSPALEAVLIGGEYYPGTDAVGSESDEAIEAFVRANMYTVAHASATCRMGVKGDEMAVVDSRGRVFGTNKLRVADVSTFPFLPPNMVAEKIADDIRRTW
ncbi:putative choline dehydrogenase [Aspergillus egyptiacus]|nr:putative choline dehydrogenase [Aspergillus egyptiacus]